MGIDSERYLFNRLPDEFRGKIERSVYSRRRKLAFKIEQFRQQIADKIELNRDYYIIESMLLEVCKFSRARRSKTCRDNVKVSPGL